MLRTFVTSHVRRQRDLSGFWSLTLDPQDRGLDEQWYVRPPAGRAAYVPGVWNTLSGWLQYEGVAWYSRRFTVGPCRAVRLTFGAVTHQANVWLDGEPLGQHYGSSLPFSFLLTLPAGDHDLVIRVDNHHDMDTTIPSAQLDWYRYGGITRPVLLEELDGPGHIASLRLTPDLAEGVGVLRVRAELTNLSDRPLDAEYTLALADRTLKSEAVRLGVGGTEIVGLSLRCEGVEAWSPRSPRLYPVTLSFAGDELIERVGFRHVSVAQHGLLLNGEPLFIKGVNRHEDHPEWGPALPEHLMARDLDLVQELGANAIRGAHYPNDPRFLDLCDERGVLFVEEIPLWQFSGEQMENDLLADRAAAMM